MSLRPFEVWASQAQRDWLDTDGRPLAEVASPLYPPSTVEVACPYSGSRKGQPMNQTAQLQVREHAEAGLATVCAAVGPDPRVADLWRAAAAIVCAPLFLPRPTPAASSALYKTTAGFLQLLTALLLESPGLATTRAAELPGPDALLTVLERGRWLVGQRQVCAGSPGEFALAWEVFCGRREAAGTPLETAPPAWAAESTGLLLALLLNSHARLLRAERDDLPGFGESAPPVDSWPLGARLWHRRPAPWMVSATVSPERDASHVLRLFAEPPPAVAQFLARGELGHREAEVAFWEAAAGL